jgi:hypothetical protein
MRPYLMIALLAVTAATAACDRTKALEDKARVSVAKAIVDEPAAFIDVLHADVAAKTACGAAKPKDPTNTTNAFIMKGDALKFYPGGIGWDSVRQLMNMDSGGNQAALRLRLDDACAFPAAWTANCAPAVAPIDSPEPGMCSLWKAGNYQKLFEHVRQ